MLLQEQNKADKDNAKVCINCINQKYLFPPVAYDVPTFITAKNW